MGRIKKNYPVNHVNILPKQPKIEDEKSNVFSKLFRIDSVSKAKKKFLRSIKYSNKKRD